MTRRLELRERYMAGWYELDADKLVSTVTDDFIFDDPAETALVTKDTLADYMVRWDERTRALGSTNEWILSDHDRIDRDGILIDWESWELVGTGLRGLAMVKTCDDGVFLERITYSPRPF